MSTEAREQARTWTYLTRLEKLAELVAMAGRDGLWQQWLARLTPLEQNGISVFFWGCYLLEGDPFHDMLVMASPIWCAVNAKDDKPGEDTIWSRLLTERTRRLAAGE